MNSAVAKLMSGKTTSQVNYEALVDAQVVKGVSVCYELEGYHYYVQSPDQIPWWRARKISKFLKEEFGSTIFLGLSMGRANLYVTAYNTSNKLVGVSALVWLRERTAWVGKLPIENRVSVLELNQAVVSDDYRGQGIGSNMVQLRMLNVKTLIQAAIEASQNGVSLFNEEEAGQGITNEILINALQTTTAVRSNIQNDRWGVTLPAVVKAMKLAPIGDGSTLAFLRNEKFGQRVFQWGTFIDGLGGQQVIVVNSASGWTNDGYVSMDQSIMHRGNDLEAQKAWWLRSVGVKEAEEHEIEGTDIRYIQIAVPFEEASRPLQAEIIVADESDFEAAMKKYSSVGAIMRTAYWFHEG